MSESSSRGREELHLTPCWIVITSCVKEIGLDGELGSEGVRENGVWRKDEKQCGNQNECAGVGYLLRGVMGRDE